MDDQQPEKRPDTRVWFGGVEVQFFGWTQYGLVYTRVGSMQTLANLTKSTVRRLLRDGTLRIEGYSPDWANPELFPEEELGTGPLPKKPDVPEPKTSSAESPETAESDGKS